MLDKLKLRGRVGRVGVGRGRVGSSLMVGNEGKGFGLLRKGSRFASGESEGAFQTLKKIKRGEKYKESEKERKESCGRKRWSGMDHPIFEFFA
jgi:hypothetical protein